DSRDPRQGAHSQRLLSLHRRRDADLGNAQRRHPDLQGRPLGKRRFAGSGHASRSIELEGIAAMVDVRLLEPFWLSTAMRGESLLFVDRGDGIPAASLLFERAERISLTSATGEIQFDAGRDFVVDPEAGVVRLTRGSRIPSVALSALYPAHDPFVLIAA